MVRAGHTRASASGGFSTRAWDVAAGWPELSQPELASRDASAVCFSGGGARAYVAALGQLAALHQMGLTSRLRYASGVSGGAWAVAAYCWGADAPWTDEGSASSETDVHADLLGRLLPPGECNWSALANLGNEGAISAVCRRSLLTEAMLGLASGLTPYAAWRRAIEIVILLPRGVPRGASFTWSNTTASDILERNPKLRSHPLARCSTRVPFPLLGATMLGPSSHAPFMPQERQYVLLEMSPLYIGVPSPLSPNFTCASGSSTLTQQIGGLVEPFAFGSPSPHSISRRLKISRAMQMRLNRLLRAKEDAAEVVADKGAILTSSLPAPQSDRYISSQSLDYLRYPQGSPEQARSPDMLRLRRLRRRIFSLADALASSSWAVGATLTTAPNSRSSNSRSSITSLTLRRGQTEQATEIADGEWDVHKPVLPIDEHAHIRAQASNSAKVAAQAAQQTSYAARHVVQNVEETSRAVKAMDHRQAALTRSATRTDDAAQEKVAVATEALQTAEEKLSAMGWVPCRVARPLAPLLGGCVVNYWSPLTSRPSVALDQRRESARLGEQDALPQQAADSANGSLPREAVESRLQRASGLLAFPPRFHFRARRKGRQQRPIKHPLWRPFYSRLRQRREYAPPSAHGVPMLLGDGGSITNFPLIGLLQRRVPRILVCLNIGDDLPPREAWDPYVEPPPSSFSDDMPPLFGIRVKASATKWTERNHVFESESFAPLIDALQVSRPSAVPGRRYGAVARATSPAAQP
eukprot:scaffold212718_cov31-Tisochrysis_lutea.AAC.6